MVEIIFIHLPKTGGSSILQTLIEAYGETHVRHFERDECLELDAKGKRISDVLSPEIRVIHGHFLFKEVSDIYKRDQSKLVTFMRSPVQRVISNYNWWKLTLQTKDSDEAMARINEPIEVYVKRPETRNKMSLFLDGIKIDQFFYVGFLESFQQDIQTLSEKLGWGSTQIFHEKNVKNRKGTKIEYNDRFHKKVKSLNKKDEKLYQSALKLFKQDASNQLKNKPLIRLFKFEL